MRRAVLQDRVKATSEPSQAQVYGHILHEVFQVALKANRWDEKWLEEVLGRIVHRGHLDDLDQIGLAVDQAMRDLKDRMQAFRAWAELFVGEMPKVRIWNPWAYYLSPMCIYSTVWKYVLIDAVTQPA